MTVFVVTIMRTSCLAQKRKSSWTPSILEDEGTLFLQTLGEYLPSNSVMSQMASVNNKTTVENSNLTLHFLLPLCGGILNLCAARDKSLGAEIWRVGTQCFGSPDQSINQESSTCQKTYMWKDSRVSTPTCDTTTCLAISAVQRQITIVITSFVTGSVMVVHNGHPELQTLTL